MNKSTLASANPQPAHWKWLNYDKHKLYIELTEKTKAQILVYHVIFQQHASFYFKASLL